MSDRIREIAETSTAIGTAVAAVVVWWRKGRHWIAEWRKERRTVAENRKRMYMEYKPGEAERTTQQFVALNQRMDKRDADLDGRLDAQDKALSDLSVAQQAIRMRLAGFWDNDPTPRFIANSDGETVDVNRAYCVLLGVGREQVLGRRYKNYIDPESAAWYLPAWEQSRTEHRSLSGKVKLLRVNAAPIWVQVDLAPHPEMPPSIEWHGRLTLLEDE